MTIDKLAKNGAEPVRKDPMPFREAFGKAEEESLLDAVKHYRESKIDPPYEGSYEKKFCDKFVEFMGGGHADAVASGTASLLHRCGCT